MARTLRLCTLAALVATLSGCAALLVGAGAAGGYAISRDSIRNTFALPYTQVFQVSRQVMGDVGLVTLEDQSRGIITADVQGTTVTATIRVVTNSSVELKVKARNQLWLPKIDVAQTVYNRIIERL